MKKNINRRKLFMIIGICILGVSLIGGTVAYFVKEIFRVSDQNTITYGLDYYINYAKGQDIVATTLNPSSSYEGSPSSDIEFWKKDNTYDIYGHIYLDVNSISDNLSDSGALKYVVTYGDVIISEGVVTNESKSILLTANIPLKTSSQLYTVHIWLDEMIATGNLSNSNLSLSVRSEATMKIMPIQEAADYIRKLYIYGKPTLINNAVSEENYYYSSEYGLMNDGFDSGNNRTDSVTTGNIRYYGKTPDNYVYFNCSDYDNQSDSTCEKWRIIGVVDGKLKIIRDEAIGNYSWDNKWTNVGSSKTDSGSNDWTDSRLMMLLNPGYTSGVSGVYDYEGSLYWNAKSGTCYSGTTGYGTKSCDFTKIGLKNSATRNMISTSTWNIGRTNAIGIYPDDMYVKERTMYNGTITASWSGKVGLMSPSDYGYAADLSTCESNLNNSSGCASSNWLINGKAQWFINAYSGSTYTINSATNGNLGHFNKPTNTEISVRPTVYLNTNIAFNGGNGTSDAPYRLGNKVNNNVTPNRGKLKDYITNLYLTNKDKKVTNNSIEYQYATSVNLMNDRLGGTTSNYDEGNIRYYGANPNNYIYFNCDDYNNQSDSTCEKWRIIGIVDGKVKIIRDESLGDYSWDYTSTGEYNNKWHDSTLQVLLNNGYYNNTDDNTYYNESTTPTTINFKIDKKGIKNDKTRKTISESIWYLGGYNSSSVYANQIYSYERGTSKCSSCTYETTWSGKIGLMYPSDYGYATDLSVCNQTLLNYNTTTNCKGTDWLFNNSFQWLITPYSSDSRDAWYVYSSGFVSSNIYVYFALGVRAVLYLDSELVLSVNGDGSSDNPYQILVS